MYILSKRVLTLLQILRILQRWIAQVTSVWQKGWGRVEERFSARVNAKRARSSCSCAHGIPASNDCHAGWYYNISPLSKLEVPDKESQPCRLGKIACQPGKQSTEIWMVGSCGWFLECKKQIMLKEDALNFPKKILKLIWNGVLGYNTDRKVWFENYDPRTSLGITTSWWLFFGKKNYVRVAFRVWKLEPPGFLYQKIPSVLFTGVKKWKNCSLNVDTLFDVLFFHSFLFGGKRPSISEVLSLFFLSFFH